MLECIYTSTKLIDNPYLVYHWNNFFHDPPCVSYINDIDAIILVMARNIFKIFRDGTNCFIGYIPSIEWDFIISADRGRIVWVKWVYPNYTFYMSDGLSFLPHEMEPIFPNFLASTYTSGVPIYLDLNKKLGLTYYMNNASIKCYNAETNAELWNFISSSKYRFTINPVTVNYVDIDHVMITGACAVSYQKSFGILVNINTGAIISTVEYPGEVLNVQFTLPVYDYNHGIFITIGTDRIVRVYANDYYPYSLGSVIPEHYFLFSSIGQDIKVRLTSIGGFACPNRPVTWYLPTGLGSLEKAVSLTDADGYAWNYYYGPLTAGGLETITVGWG